MSVSAIIKLTEQTTFVERSSISSALPKTFATGSSSHGCWPRRRQERTSSHHGSLSSTCKAVRRFEPPRFGGTNMNRRRSQRQATLSYFVNRHETVQVRRYDYEPLCPRRPPGTWVGCSTRKRDESSPDWKSEALFRKRSSCSTLSSWYLCGRMDACTGGSMSQGGEKVRTAE